MQGFLLFIHYLCGRMACPCLTCKASLISILFLCLDERLMKDDGGSFQFPRAGTNLEQLQDQLLYIVFVYIVQLSGYEDDIVY